MSATRRTRQARRGQKHTATPGDLRTHDGIDHPVQVTLPGMEDAGSQPSAPFYGVGDVATHFLFGEVVIVAVHPLGTSWKYTCDPIWQPVGQFVTVAPYLS